MQFHIPFNNLFRNEIEPQCAYCSKGKKVDDETVLCRKKGVVLPEDACPSFRYNPLKRVPPSPTALDFTRLRDEDFTL